MNPMNWNKRKRAAGDESADFIWASAPQPVAQSQPAPQAPAQPGPPSEAPEPTAGSALDQAVNPWLEPESPQQPPEQSAFRPSRRVLQVSLAALAVLVCGSTVYEFGFAGSSTPQPGRAEVQSAASAGAMPPTAATSLSPTPSSGGTISLPGYASPSHPASAAHTSTTTSTTKPAQVVHATPSVVPTSPASSSPVTVSTPSPEATATAASDISGSIQCQSSSVEGVWVQAANGGSGWAPWISSAARPDYATYSYTLPHGGEYSLHIGCGGTTSSWKVATYSGYYGGTVNNFYCYDESGSSLYTYCAKTSS